MRLRHTLGLLLACLLATIAAAQTTFTWTGLAGDFVFATPGNWQGNVAPTGSPTDNIVFPNLTFPLDDEFNHSAFVNSPIALGDITFSGDYYTFALYGAGPITLHGNITASSNVGTINTPVVLAAGNHNFTGSHHIFQNGTVSGTGAITVSSGTLALFGSGNSYSGGTTINGGTVITSSSSALGTGPVTINSGGLTLSGSGYTLDDNLLLGTNVTLSSYVALSNPQFGNAGTTLAPIAAGPTTVHINVGYSTGPVVIGGSLINGSGATTYAFTDENGVGGILGGYFRLTGTNTHTGGTAVNADAIVVFGTAASIPATGLITADEFAYAGIENPTLQAAFLGKLDAANFIGTIGFENDDSSFTGNIDLSGFAGNGGSASIGTRDIAFLTGLITPSSTSNQYRFRNSGTLFVGGANPLSGSRSVHSTSFTNASIPGMLVLGQSVANTYTGGTYADGAAIAFNSSGALSASTTIHLANGGYVSVTDASTLSIASLVAKLGTVTNGGVIGFDNSANLGGGFNTYLYAAPVDFSALTSDVYLGTAGGHTAFSGTISTANGNTGDYFLTGYGYSEIEVSSQLTGSKALHVGVAQGGSGTVFLEHVNNTYSGGTILNAGSLIVAAAGSLGSGPITADPVADGTYSLYLEGPSNSTLANSITLNAGELVLYWGTNSTFSGVISGTGSLSIYSDLILSNANTFSGDTSIPDGTLVTATNNTAFGSGGLSLDTGSTVQFTSSAPQIGSLLVGGTYFYDDDGVYERSSVLKFATSANATLTINQTEDGYFEGAIGQGSGVGSLVKNGSGALTIGGLVGQDNNVHTPYTGGTTINGGTLIAGSASALGTGLITINGGELGTDVGVTLTNAITFGASGGTLGGNGTFSVPITAGANVTLSPGASPGTLTFTAGLTLAPGGTLEFEVQAATGVAGTGFDLVNVSAGLLDITASAASPFTIQLTSLDALGEPGNVSDFSSSTGYTWMLFQGNSVGGITGFADNKFTLDTSGFTNGLNGGVFSLSQGVNGGNPALYLNFSPVPEPSTYALITAGLLSAVFLRRRRT